MTAVSAPLFQHAHTTMLSNLWNTVINLFERALEDGTMGIIEGRIEAVEKADEAGLYEQPDKGRACFEWKVEAERRQKLRVETDGGHDGVLYHQTREDFRGHLEGMMPILQFRAQ